MTRLGRPLFVVLLGFMVSPATGLAGGFCATTSPESVLSCLTDAYARQDLSAYSNLLADDYAFYFGRNPNSWGRDMELKTATKLFNPDSCKNLSMTFAPGYQVLAGDAKNTWTIKNLEVTLSLDSLRPTDPGHYQMVSEGLVMKVRQVTEPEPHFQIYYWWCPEPTK
jgi:hypothetical protein